MSDQTETMVRQRGKMLPLVVAGLCLALAAGGALVYFVQHAHAPATLPSPGTEASHPGSATHSDPGTAAASPAKPELLLTTSRRDTQILAIDFFGVRDQLRGMTPADRKQYILEECLKLYIQERDRAGIAKARLYALYVPDRDEYAKGSFRNLTELAIIDTDRASATAPDKPLAERAGQVEWKSGTDAP
jgi:hypothetical protein